MAGVVSRGQTVAGLIYDPVGRDWHKGLKGVGAWGESVNGRTRDLRVAPDIIRAGLDVQGAMLSGSLRVSHVGTQRMDAVDASGDRRLRIDGYTVVDLNLRADLGKGIYGALGVSNLTNKRYYNINQAATDQPSSIEFVGAPQDLRRAYLSVGWKY